MALPLVAVSRLLRITRKKRFRPAICEHASRASFKPISRFGFAVGASAKVRFPRQTMRRLITPFRRKRAEMRVF